jgi:hypothetical protein
MRFVVFYVGGSILVLRAEVDGGIDPAECAMAIDVPCPEGEEDHTHRAVCVERQARDLFVFREVGSS